MNIDQLFARSAHGIKPGLDVITALLEALGGPHANLKVIHVAGTNGKGSVCAMIESVLRESGQKTGLYTSPHLFKFNERFRVNGKDISNEKLEALAGRVEAAAATLDTRPATFFEIATAMAFEHFKQEGVDFAVIETGMGGRWDATNVVIPLMSIITRIGIDHADYLGADLKKIAGEKAGIIKEGVPVICGPMPVEAESVVYAEAAEKNSPILGSEEAAFCQVLERRRTDQLIDIEVPGSDYRSIRLPLGGSFQLENCGIAVAALEDISDLANVKLQVKKGLERVRWAGRFQVLSMKPPIIFDGAHNLSAAGALTLAIDESFPRFHNGFLFGFMKDKDVAGILSALKPSIGTAMCMTLPGERAMSAEEIVKIAESVGVKMKVVESPAAAKAWLESGKKRLLCCTGSLFMAQEMKKHGMYNGC